MNPLFRSVPDAEGPVLTVAEKHDGNPVGELQKITHQHLWSSPVYEYIKIDQPPHARGFICTVKLNSYQETGRYLLNWWFGCFLFLLYVIQMDNTYATCIQ